MTIVFRDFLSLVPPDTPTKTGRVLHALCCGRSFNRFEAEYKLNDHALNSTVSALANKYGIQITRSWETVAGYNLTPTHCCRYRLDSDTENLRRSWQLLKGWGYGDRYRDAKDAERPRPAL